MAFANAGLQQFGTEQAKADSGSGDFGSYLAAYGLDKSGLAAKMNSSMPDGWSFQGGKITRTPSGSAPPTVKPDTAPYSPAGQTPIGTPIDQRALDTLSMGNTDSQIAPVAQSATTRALGSVVPSGAAIPPVDAAGAEGLSATGGGAEGLAAMGEGLDIGALISEFGPLLAAA